MTYREVCEKGERALAEAGIGREDARLEARLLLEYVCGTSRNDLLVHGDREVPPRDLGFYEQLTAGRSKRIPLQQLTGQQDFMGLDFKVDEHVLIPRQDTEILVEEVLKNLHDGMRVLDMCTGSGCILISLLRYSNDCTGVGVDISSEALAVAEENKARLLGSADEALSGGDLPEAGAPDGNLSGASDGALSGALSGNGSKERERRCTFLQGDLFENVEGQFDIIVSNPPYIPSGVIETLMPEVRDHEPRQALDGAEDGLIFYRRIVAESAGYRPGGGMLFFEIGYDQAEAVSGLMEEAGFLEINVVKDYAGLDRVVYGTKGFVLQDQGLG